LAEEKFPVLGHSLEKPKVRNGAIADPGAEQAPEVVIVSGHAELPGLDRRTESFLVEQARLFPKGPLGSEDTNGKTGLRIERGKLLDGIRLDTPALVRSIV